jgi:hypothetical protein
LEHQHAKRFYLWVHKGKFTQGITKQQRHEWILHKMKGLGLSGTSTLAHKHKYGNHNTQSMVTSAKPHVAFKDGKALPPSPPHEHHHISMDMHHKISLLHWLGDIQYDPALKVCAAHLLK